MAGVLYPRVLEKKETVLISLWMYQLRLVGPKSQGS